MGKQSVRPGHSDFMAQDGDQRSATGERAPLLIKAERINSRPGSWERRLGAVLHCGIVRV
jgi:hypothetical protein